MLTPLAFIVGFAAFLAFPRIHDNPILVASFTGAAVVLIAWYGWLWRRGRPLKVEISLRPQHYLQAIAHASIFVYWGIYWHPIQDAALLIAAQIVFAFAFDALLSWTRKNEFVLGFGPFPIIFSTNLFLRFRDDWFYWQFVMIAVGFLAKELIRWERDGKRVHIFNPSSFPLALFSLVLIVTHTSQFTWAREIATLLILPPHIYLFIFLVALPGQFLFGVSSMTLPAVLTTYAFSMVYLKLTGTYFFFDSNVPIAVFLGMHLLFTDPSTAPKSELGRILFGVCYGLSVVGLYAGLTALGAPTYYDKLLQVPIMNLFVKAFDRVGRAASWSWLAPAGGGGMASRARRAAYVAVWIIAFGLMTSARGLVNEHPGQMIPFWESACSADRPHACENLAQMHQRYCADGSPWSCNELGVLAAAGKVHIDAAPERLFQSACRFGLVAGCENAAALKKGEPASHRGDPRFADYLLVLQGGRGPLPSTNKLDVYTRACDQGFVAGCGSLGDTYFKGDGVPRDQSKGRALWKDSCERGHAMSCSNLGVMSHLGDGVPKDDIEAARYLKRACEMGELNACHLADELKGQP